MRKSRVAWVMVGFLVITLSLWGRLFWLQVFEPHHWVSLARRQHLEVVELLPTRGSIVDRSSKPLAVSIRLSSVFADPRHIKDPRRTARLLTPWVHRPLEEVEQKLRQKKRGFIWIARRVPYESARKIKKMRLNGIHLVMEPKRVYPQGFLASHLIGFAGIDSQGLEGLELAYEPILKGESGWRWLSRDARRRPTGAWETPMVSPRDGLELVLTLDTSIQFIAERELERVYRQTRAKYASIVVMNPKTGEILAMANRPTYDPNGFSQVPADSRRNRALTDPFEPGSVFKVVTAATALAKRSVGLTEKFFCENGEYPVAGRVLHDHRPHGWLTFREVITQSSNIGTVKVAMRLGPEAIYEGMKAFGFGDPTRVGIPGESSGMVKHPSQWSRPSMTTIPMGHEVAVTTLQLAQMISVVANDGILMRPWIVKEIRSPSGDVVRRFGPTAVRRVVDEQVAGQLQEILAGVVEEGTGRLAQVPGVRAGGKTGTAQKVEPNGQYSHSKYVASFAGFVPVENPELAIAVVVDEPRPVYFGGVVSAPVFKQVALETLAYLHRGNVVTARAPNDE